MRVLRDDFAHLFSTIKKNKKEIERTMEVTRVIISFLKLKEGGRGNEYTRECNNHSTRIARVNN